VELEYTDTRRRGKVIVALGLILALGAGAGAFFLLNQAQQQAGQSGLHRTTIVVAARAIAARKAITSDDLTQRDVPVDPTNAQGVYSDPNAIVGLIAAVTILEGQPIYSNLLASNVQGGQFSILDPGATVAPDSPAWRAVSITVPDDRAVGGQVRPGDTVDVFFTAPVTVPADTVASGRYISDKSTRITYQNLVVLGKSTTFYILRVPIPIAEEISHVQATGTGSFSLALRPPADTRTVDVTSLGQTTNLIIQRYGLPIPQPYPRGAGPFVQPSPSATPKPSATP
jgi:Flp pilus assembly protein CpaB